MGTVSELRAGTRLHHFDLMTSFGGSTTGGGIVPHFTELTGGPFNYRCQSYGSQGGGLTIPASDNLPALGTS